MVLDGERPSPTSPSRYKSTLSAIDTLTKELEDNYRVYAVGVDRLCPPDGIAELGGQIVRGMESIDDLMICRVSPEVFPVVSFIGNKINLGFINNLVD